MANTNMSEVKGNEIRFMKKQHRMKWNWTAAEFYTSYSHSFFFFTFSKILLIFTKITESTPKIKINTQQRLNSL